MAVVTESWPFPRRGGFMQQPSDFCQRYLRYLGFRAKAEAEEAEAARKDHGQSNESAMAKHPSRQLIVPGRP